jgi:undecaprenyl-diphosphatase
MSLLQAGLLGIVQGVTEFLPISSSAHLVLVPWALGWHFEPGQTFVFDVLVQAGTLTAVIAYFWSDLRTLFVAAVAGLLRRHPLGDPHARLAWLLVVASLPAALLGVLIKDTVEATFSSPMAVSGFLLGTAALLVLSERARKQDRQMASLSVAEAVWVGLAQALALFPGISRSGATIAAGLSCGLQRREAARFSFLMSIPVMLGASLVAAGDLIQTTNTGSQMPALAVGFLAAAVTGYLSIRWLLGYLTRRPLTVFALYCLALGGLGILASVLGRG